MFMLQLTLVAVIVKLYFLYKCGKCISKKTMGGKTVIITGANSGIGREITLDLARRGARVIMACRNMKTANKIKDEIVSATGNKQVVALHVDLTDEQSVRSFAASVLVAEARLDVLMHHAGIVPTPRNKLTPDGLDAAIVANHLGPFLLTHLLIDLLKKSSPSRVVVTTSFTYMMAHSRVVELLAADNHLPGFKYADSKLANILFTKELARRLQGTGVTANCCHPGVVDTAIWDSAPLVINILANICRRTFFKTPKEGAQTNIYLAVSEEVEHKTGGYYEECKEHWLLPKASNMEAARKLWEESERLARLQPSDPRP